MEIIGLEKVEFYGYHGFYPEERTIGGRYQIDIEVSVDLDRDHWEDNIGETVNYEKLHQICLDEMNIQQKLIETVALRILNRTKALGESVQSVSIQLRKLNPPIKGQIRSAFVKMTL